MPVGMAGGVKLLRSVKLFEPVSHRTTIPIRTNHQTERNVSHPEQRPLFSIAVTGCHVCNCGSKPSFVVWQPTTCVPIKVAADRVRFSTHFNINSPTPTPNNFQHRFFHADLHSPPLHHARGKASPSRLRGGGVPHQPNRRTRPRRNRRRWAALRWGIRLGLAASGPRARARDT